MKVPGHPASPFWMPLGAILFWGLAGGLVAALFLRSAEFAGSLVAFQYAAASAFLSAGLSVSLGLVAWGTMRLAAGASPRGRRLGVVAAQVTAAMTPIALALLIRLHKASPSDPGVGSAEGIAMTAAVLGGLGAVSLVLVLLGTRYEGDLRWLATAGCGAAVAGLAFLVWSGVDGEAPFSQRPNLLIISIDSLRRDVFDEYVEEYASPELRRFVSKGSRYSNAHTTFSHSLASHGSLFTGLYPAGHGARIWKTPDGMVLGSPLRPDVPTLADTLRGAGYETITIQSNPWLGPPFGLDDGFETSVIYGVARRLSTFHASLAMDASVIGPFLRYLDLHMGRKLHYNSGIFLGWLRSRQPSRPFFAFLHYIEMHTPNVPPAAYRDRFCSGRFRHLDGYQMLLEVENDRIEEEHMPEAREHLGNLHLAAMAQMDDYLAPVLRELMEGGILDDTLVFLVSDHGENLYQKGGTYGKSHVYHPSSEVPFVMFVPGQSGGTLHRGLVSLVDIPPTFLELAGLQGSDPMEGISLLSRSRESGGQDDWVFLEGWDRKNRAFARAVLFADRRKWVEDGAQRGELYDLAADPKEEHELSADDGEAAEVYRRRSAPILEGMSEGGDTSIPVEELPPAVADQLRALGYVR